jgi:hypothetical protein
MHIGCSPPCGLLGTKVIACSILGGLPVRSFDAIASASVYQSDFSLLMKVQADRLRLVTIFGSDRKNISIGPDSDESGQALHISGS